MDDTGVIGPLYKYRSASRISPTREYTSIILSRLIDDGLILVDPDTDLRMLDCQSPNFPYDFNMDYVQYLVDVNEESLEESFQILAEGDFYNPETDVKGAAELWKELAVEECFEYLTYHSKDVGFGCPAQHKPRAMLNFLLDSFSVSQVFSIISNRLSYASKAFLSANGKMTRTHALNYTVSGCYSFGTNAINKGWKIYSYNRPYGTKLPSLCDYFYNSVLKIGENCFYLAPTFSNLERFSCALQYINR